MNPTATIKPSLREQLPSVRFTQNREERIAFRAALWETGLYAKEGHENHLSRRLGGHLPYHLNLSQRRTRRRGRSPFRRPTPRCHTPRRLAPALRRHDHLRLDH